MLGLTGSATNGCGVMPQGIQIKFGVAGLGTFVLTTDDGVTEEKDNVVVGCLAGRLRCVADYLVGGVPGWTLGAYSKSMKVLDRSVDRGRIGVGSGKHLCWLLLPRGGESSPLVRLITLMGTPVLCLGWVAVESPCTLGE